MRIYLTPPQPSRGLQRIADALVKYKPEWVEVVQTQAEAELVIIYAIGRRDRVEARVDYLLSTNRKYAVIQVSLRSTMAPRVIDWLDIWNDAEVVWSYYDLQQAFIDDANELGHSCSVIDFYHAPLGADAEVFAPDSYRSRQKDYIIASSGLSRLSESVRECAIAAEQVNRSMFHLGPELRLPGHVLFSKDKLTDKELAVCYSACEFVSGLRRKEGFELPAIEGLLCGARPVVFDTPDYRWCYGNHALYIPEGSRAEVVDSLVEIFKRGAPPVTPEERELAVARYDWKKIVGGFYERLE